MRPKIKQKGYEEYLKESLLRSENIRDKKGNIIEVKKKTVVHINKQLKRILQNSSRLS